jgi:hypothetical protein
MEITEFFQILSGTVFLRSLLQLLVTANVVPSLPIRHPDDGRDKFL